MKIPSTRLRHGLLYCAYFFIPTLLGLSGQPTSQPNKAAPLSVEQIRQLAVDHMLKHFDK